MTVEGDFALFPYIHLDITHSTTNSHQLPVLLGIHEESSANPFAVTIHNPNYTDNDCNDSTVRGTYRTGKR